MERQFLRCGHGFSCSLVAIAAAFGKGDQLFAVFVFFGMGGFILLRYLGYFDLNFLVKVYQH